MVFKPVMTPERHTCLWCGRSGVSRFHKLPYLVNDIQFWACDALKACENRAKKGTKFSPYDTDDNYCFYCNKHFRNNGGLKVHVYKNHVGSYRHAEYEAEHERLDALKTIEDNTVVYTPRSVPDNG